MVSNTKLALWTAQQVRQIKAIVSDTYKMDAKSQHALQGLESVKRFATVNRKLKEQGKDAEEIKEQTEIPQVVVFNTMVKEFIGEVTKSPTSFGALELAKLNNSVEGWTRNGGWKYLAPIVKQFKISNMYQSQWKRLETSFRFDLEVLDVEEGKPKYTVKEIWREILKHFYARAKLRELQGAAPMGEIERALQTFLEQQKQ